MSGHINTAELPQDHPKCNKVREPLLPLPLQMARQGLVVEAEREEEGEKAAAAAAAEEEEE